MKQEEVDKNYGNLELINDIWKYVVPYRRKFFLGSAIRIFSDIIWLYPVWAMAEIINFVSQYNTGDDTTYVWNLLWGIVAVSIIYFPLHDLAKYFVFQVSEKANIDAQLRGVEYMEKIDISWHEKENAGNKMQKIIRAGGAIDNLLRMYIIMFLKAIVNTISVIFILSFLNIYFSVILIFIFVTYFLLSAYLTKKAKKQSHLVNIEWEKFNGKNFEIISNIFTIKSLSILKNTFKHAKNIAVSLMEKIRIRIIYYRSREVIIHAYQEFCFLMIIVFTLLNIFNGNLEIGVLAMVILYFKRVRESADELARMYNNFIISKIHMLRMKEVLDTPIVVENSGNLEFDKNWKNINIQNLYFNYHDVSVLDNFSLRIKRGEKIGIVGISGTGKSTFFKLLLKLYNPGQGEIKFDNTSLKEIKRGSYIKNVTIVPQETELFNLSLKDNITLGGTSKVDEEKLQKAIKIAHVHDFLHKLPEGLNSLVGEKGTKLSGGEKQRVGIARAIYRNCDLLLLDEATSHLDTISENKIQDALHKSLQGITAIVIAHRLSTIKEMDRIIVIKQGKIIEQGTFDKLINNGKNFYELWRKQQF